jgi:hypothetical protein
VGLCFATPITSGLCDRLSDITLMPGLNKLYLYGVMFQYHCLRHITIFVPETLSTVLRKRSTVT